jgi:hypothetical protein
MSRKNGDGDALCMVISTEGYALEDPCVYARHGSFKGVYTSGSRSKSLLDSLPGLKHHRADTLPPGPLDQCLYLHMWKTMYRRTIYWLQGRLP